MLENETRNAVNATAEVNSISEDITSNVPPTTKTSAGLTEQLDMQPVMQNARRNTRETDYVTFVNGNESASHPGRPAGVPAGSSLSEQLTRIGDEARADFGQEYSEGFSASEEVYTYEPTTDGSYGGGSGGNNDGGNGGSSGSHNHGKPHKSRRQPKSPVYVTRKALVICLILAMIISTALGAGIGVVVGGRTSGGAGAGSSSSLAEATGSEMTVAQIIDKNENSVVEINTKITEMSFFGSTQVEGAGSGVIVSKDGYIATNFHVIEDSNSVSVTLHNGEEYSAKVVGYDASNDIAILKIDAKNLTPATYGSSSELTEGDTSVAIGNPLGQLGGTATTGIISSLDRSLEIDGKTLNLLQTDAAINPGNSGGGLFNAKGELIGIVVAKSSGNGVEGLGFAIPIDTAKPIIEDIIKNGSKGNGSKDTGTPAAGVTIVEVSADQLARYNVSTPGVYIAEVKGTNAQKAGMKVGDRVVTIDETPITDSNTMIKTIQAHKVGDEVTFTVERDGQQLQLTFKLEAASQF